MDSANAAALIGFVVGFGVCWALLVWPRRKNFAKMPDSFRVMDLPIHNVPRAPIVGPMCDHCHREIQPGEILFQDRRGVRFCAKCCNPVPRTSVPRGDSPRESI